MATADTNSDVNTLNTYRDQPSKCKHGYVAQLVWLERVLTDCAVRASEDKIKSARARVGQSTMISDKLTSAQTNQTNRKTHPINDQRTALSLCLLIGLG